MIVKLPNESPKDDDGKPLEKPSWARTPLETPFVYKEVQIKEVELTTAEPYPSDSWRHEMPPTIDVFLPGKVVHRFRHYLPYILGSLVIISVPGKILKSARSTRSWSDWASSVLQICLYMHPTPAQPRFVRLMLYTCYPFQPLLDIISRRPCVAVL
jgi:hypothetical protein